MPKKSPLIIEDDNESKNEVKDFEIKEDILKEVEEHIEKDIPSGYIPIELVSNGRFKDIPRVLHFRDFSGHDALDISPSNESDRIKAIGKVLKRMCFEQFEILDLPIQDVIYILRVLQATFINSVIEKEIYLDDTLPEGEDEGQLDHKSNIEKVDIDISSLKVAFLGKDFDDKVLSDEIKVPFTITDSTTKDKIKVKYPTLRDYILAENYCETYYKDTHQSFLDIKKGISSLQKIKNKEEREVALDNYLLENESRANEYYSFMREYSFMVAKILQCLQIIEINANPLETIKDKWVVYTEKLSDSFWKKYEEITNTFPFGISEEVEIQSYTLNKKIKRRLQFQLSDFLQFNRRKDNDRFSVSFD